MGEPKLISAALVADHELELVFSDGVKAIVDFSEELFGGVFDKLKDANILHHLNSNLNLELSSGKMVLIFRRNFFIKRHKAVIPVGIF